jgi:hypothetical protein
MSNRSATFGDLFTTLERRLPKKPSRSRLSRVDSDQKGSTRSCQQMKTLCFR